MGAVGRRFIPLRLATWFANSFVALTLVLAGGAAVYAAHSYADQISDSSQWLLTLKQIYWRGYESYIDGGLWLAVPMLLLLSWWRPANPEQPLFSKALLTDMAYSARLLVLAAVLAPFYIVYLRFVFSALGFALPSSPIADLPLWLRVVIGYVAVDFLGWLHHYVRHAVPTFWWFHEVHHSQVEMNPFTNGRFHIVDWFVAQNIKFIPASFLMGSFDIALGYLFFHSVHDRLVHSNIRSNLGWLRYIFVTPQSHRLHHSLQREHFDKNFGVSLCIWDRLFGTHHEDEHSYPVTGVKSFPDERGIRWWQLPRCWCQQWLVPFRKAALGQTKSSEL